MHSDCPALVLSDWAGSPISRVYPPSLHHVPANASASAPSLAPIQSASRSAVPVPALLAVLLDALLHVGLEGLVALLHVLLGFASRCVTVFVEGTTYDDARAVGRQETLRAGMQRCVLVAQAVAGRGKTHKPSKSKASIRSIPLDPVMAKRLSEWGTAEDRTSRYRLRISG